MSAASPSGHGVVARVVLYVLRLYREGLSPLRPACCRFTPTCSGYAVDAIEVHGLPRGTWLAVRRLLRCHPFHRGGHDPVPPVVARSSREGARLVADHRPAAVPVRSS